MLEREHLATAIAPVACDGCGQGASSLADETCADEAAGRILAILIGTWPADQRLNFARMHYGCARARFMRRGQSTRSAIWAAVLKRQKSREKPTVTDEAYAEAPGLFQ